MIDIFRGIREPQVEAQQLLNPMIWQISMHSDSFDDTADRSPPFEEVEHTADIALKIHGKSLKDLFVHSAMGFNNILGEFLRTASIGEAEHDLKIDAVDGEHLLIQWLSELAFYAEVRCEIFDHFDIRKISPTYLEAKITGRRFDSLPTPIKAVTYHNLKIIDTEKGLEATIVFDI